MKTFLFSLLALFLLTDSRPSDDCYVQLKKALKNKADTIYFKNPDQLVLLGSLSKFPKFYGLNVTSPKGNQYSIEIKTGQFKASEHILQLFDTSYIIAEGQRRMNVNCKDFVDGKEAYGLDCDTPQVEFQSFEVAVNGKKIQIPASAYKNLFEPNLNHSRMPMTAYESRDGKQLHLYFFGSDGAGAYRAKFVFDHSRYLTTIAIEDDAGFACEF